jgi:hypothetical protein
VGWSPSFQCVVLADGERVFRVGHVLIDEFLEFAAEVGQHAGHTGTTRRQSRLVDPFVVVLQGHALDVDLHSNRNLDPCRPLVGRYSYVPARP